MAWDAAARAKYRPATAGYTSTISDAEWDILVRLLPDEAPTGRRRLHSLRAVLEAVFHLLGTGCQWRNLPREFPPWSTVQNWFYRWRDDGTLVRVNHALLMLERERVGREASPSAGSIDAQTMKTAEGGPRGYDAGKKTLGRKRHALVDTEGNIVAIRVGTAGEQDRDGIVPLLAGIRRLQPWLRHVWADGGYAGAKLRDAAAKVGGWKIEIVRRSDDMRGFVLLPRRWVVERTFSWLSRCRRLAKDYERTVASAEAWVYLASIRLMLRRLGRA